MIIMNRERFKEAVFEGLVNSLVAFFIAYPYLCVIHNINYVPALGLSLMLGMVRFAVYLADKLDYVELPNFKKLTLKEKAKNSSKNLFRFVKVAR